MPYAPPREPGPFSLPMRPERLNWCLEVIGWSRGEFARRLDISASSADQMTRGKRNVPHRVAVWIESLAQMMLALPEPFFWNDNSATGRTRHTLGGAGPEVDSIEAAWNAPKVPNPVAELLGEREAARGGEE